ncbi:hypothetical protein VP01_3240g1 [Puccinia sorghi]|uniref:mRNA-decapping enzyme C-terminal domain-containing protein n=1 Tax=Puccinia sorghi TaxID=27349 RepID=A0A0L6UY19_9BASI|nr:hypothetical protein VP01_3240g1 [Puccinia sorghi]
MDPRTINFNVLRRHDNQISSILDSTSYAVIYRYFHGAWSKTGFEGTLFIFQRDIHPFYGVFVLNRQGLDNLCEGLLAGWDVDLDEGLIIWRSAGATGDADDGQPSFFCYCIVFLFHLSTHFPLSASPKTSSMAFGCMRRRIEPESLLPCSSQLIENASSKKNSPQQVPPSTSPPPVSLSHPVPRVPIITAGQTISLDQLFGVGSVCSEPPPQTSALPHPGASVTDPDEEKENLLPSQVMSPDPSDLPKGMQLLDSLFQKAAIKSQGSHQNNPTNPQPINQHPTSIHQLLDQVSGPTSKPPPQNYPHSSDSRRDRRESSGQENLKQQYATIDQSAQPNHRRGVSQRNDYRSLNASHNNNPHSRQSSGGSSSHSRNGKIPMSHNPTTQTHQHTQPAISHPHPSNVVNIVAAPVPIENANAEARHNILSLLGHPAAARPDDVYSAGTNPQNPMLVAPPAGNQAIWPNSSPDSRGGSNPRNLYSPQLQHEPQQASSASHHAHSSPRSRVASQEASPHQNPHQGPLQHPLPMQSHAHGNSTERTPPRVAQINSASHSPNGPRPQVDSRHHHPHQPPPPPQQQPPPGGNHLTAGGGSQGIGNMNGGPAGPGYTGSAWPFDKIPNRALSPLNPARQSPSNLGVHRGRYPQSSNNNNRKSFQQHRQQMPMDHSPPHVNDSSRPSRSHSYTDTNNSNDRRTSTHSNHSPSQTNPGQINSKLAVESLDQLLVDQKLENNLLGSAQNNHIHQQQLADANPLDKAHFVHSILDLINNNGAFVDTLYARYLARYAEKYL